MAITKMTGSRATFGGAIILTAPTIYDSLTTSSTSSTKFYGTPQIETSATDATVGGLKLGGATQYIQQIAFAAASWTTAVTTNFNTGVLLPAKAVVTDAFFDITTVASSLTLTAGTTGDPNGFLTGIATTPVGPKCGSLTAGSVTYGTLLVDQLCTTIPAKARVDWPNTSVAKNVAIGRSATNLDMSVVGNLYITYVVPE